MLSQHEHEYTSLIYMHTVKVTREYIGVCTVTVWVCFYICLSLHLPVRLKGELEEKHERWLSCQQRYDTVHHQLSSWQHREVQMNRKYCAAEEEATRLWEDLERVKQETRKERWAEERMAVYNYLLYNISALITSLLNL